MDRYIFIKGKSTADFSDDEILVLEQLGDKLMNGSIVKSRLESIFLERTGKKYSSKVLFGWLDRIKEWDNRVVRCQGFF